MSSKNYRVEKANISFRNYFVVLFTYTTVPKSYAEHNWGTENVAFYQLPWLAGKMKDSFLFKTIFQHTQNSEYLIKWFCFFNFCQAEQIKRKIVVEKQPENVLNSKYSSTKCYKNNNKLKTSPMAELDGFLN